jgi:hypothetical protein
MNFLETIFRMLLYEGRVGACMLALINECCTLRPSPWRGNYFFHLVWSLKSYFITGQTYNDMILEKKLALAKALLIHFGKRR